MLAEAVATPKRGRRHGRGPLQLTPDGGGPSVVCSLLQAAGITPTTDEPGFHPTAATWHALPLVQLLDTEASGQRYSAVSPVDKRGRLADRTPLKVLGWEPGAPITISMIPTVGIILVRGGGPETITQQGHLRLPANIRHGCRIQPGDRLLVMAHPTEGVLAAYTPGVIEAMASAYHTTLAARDIA